MTFRALLALVLGLSALVAVLAGAVVARQMLVANGDEVERARVGRVLASLAAATETNLAVGLSLDNLGMLQPQLERERAADARLLALDIFSITGRSTFSTDRGAIGEPVPASWIEQARADLAGVWRVEERGEVAYGRTIVNDIGLPVAGLAVTLSAAERKRTTDAITLRLVGVALPLAAAAALAAAFAGMALGGRLNRAFGHAATLLAGAEPAAEAAGAMIEAEARRAASAWSAAETRLASALRRLEELDDAA